MLSKWLTFLNRPVFVQLLSIFEETNDRFISENYVCEKIGMLVMLEIKKIPNKTKQIVIENIPNELENSRKIVLRRGKVLKRLRYWDGRIRKMKEVILFFNQKISDYGVMEIFPNKMRVIITISYDIFIHLVICKRNLGWTKKGKLCAGLKSLLFLVGGLF